MSSGEGPEQWYDLKSLSWPNPGLPGKKPQSPGFSVKIWFLHFFGLSGMLPMLCAVWPCQASPSCSIRKPERISNKPHHTRIFNQLMVCFWPALCHNKFMLVIQCQCECRKAVISSSKYFQSKNQRFDGSNSFTLRNQSENYLFWAWFKRSFLLLKLWNV